MLGRGSKIKRVSITALRTRGVIIEIRGYKLNNSIKMLILLLLL